MWQADLQVLNEYPQVQSISAFSSIYNNSGIFGIQATTVMILFRSFVVDIDLRYLTWHNAKPLC